MYRSSRLEVLCKKGVLKNFAKFLRTPPVVASACKTTDFTYFCFSVIL